MVVTPRVNQYNGKRVQKDYLLNKRQADLYSIAFCAPKFYKKLKFYKEELAFYRATPRDILHYKFYIAALITGMLTVVLMLVI
jgi:hypothetical protein